MKPNMGPKDRVIRIYLGVILASVLIYFNSAWAILGVPVFVNGIVGYCPLYTLLGVNTLPKPQTSNYA